MDVYWVLRSVSRCDAVKGERIEGSTAEELAEAHAAREARRSEGEASRSAHPEFYFVKVPGCVVRFAECFRAFMCMPYGALGQKENSSIRLARGASVKIQTSTESELEP